MANLEQLFKKTEGGMNVLVCDMFTSNDKGTDCVKGSAEIVVD